MEQPRSLSGVKILLVEDSDDTREAFARLLALEGATVDTARDARTARELAMRHPPDVLLTDLGLPDIAGDALITSVLATAPHRPKVVVVTGYGEPYVGRAWAAGADVVLVKPVVWTRLVGHLVAARTGQPLAA